MKITLNEQEITEAIEMYVRQQCVSGCKMWNVELIDLDISGERPIAVISVEQDDLPRPVPAPAAVPPRTY